MGKNAKKRALRRVAGEFNQHTQQCLDNAVTRSKKLSEKIEKLGGSEKVHKMHLSCIVGAKPKRKGKITSPDNPFRGYYITQFEWGGYFIFIPQKRGEVHSDNRELSRKIAPALEGVVCRFNGKLGVALPPTIQADNVVRTLSVKWGF
jgi:hypothetical protein